jgi:S1-C subfamily serine protease
MRNALRGSTILLLLLLLPASTLGQEKKAEEVYKSILPSVMTLIVEKKDGSVVTGSAFLAIKDGLAITAWHVIQNGVRAIGRFASGEEFEVSGVVDKDEKRDTAIIRVKVFGRATLTLTAAQPDVGSRVYVIGARKDSNSR